MKRPLRSEQFLLNLLGQKVSIFPISKGKTVEKGDLVVVNTRTLQASKAKKEDGYYAIGCAVRIVTDSQYFYTQCPDFDILCPNLTKTQLTKYN